MADSRFFDKTGEISLGQLGEIAEIVIPAGMEDKVFDDVNELAKAGPKDISWAFIPAVREALKQTKAGAVIVPEKFISMVPQGCIALVSKDPHRSYGLVAQAFYPVEIQPAISDKAVIDSSAELGEGCCIEAGAVIGPNVKMGARCHVQANAVIGRGVQMGEGCIIGATSTVSHCVMGHKVYVYPGAHIGQDGFGFAMSGKGPVKVPQLGRVIIGNDVEIGSSSMVDRGAMGDTVIGDGTRIDNLVQVAHNVKLGKCCILVSQVGIAGSCEFGNFVVAGGQSGFAGHLKIGDGAQIGAQAGLMNDVPAGVVMMGSPAVGRLDFMRQTLAIQNLIKKKEGKPLSLTEKLALKFLKKKKA